MKYTHNNNELRLKHKNKKVRLRGWVSKTRNLGGLIFIDLRDMYGITQLVVKPNSKYYDLASKLRNEYVIFVHGKVVERSNKNKNIDTGDIEIDVSKIELINKSKQPPLIISDKTDALEETRLKYRYLDLRRPIQKNYLLTRAKIVKSVRKTLDSYGFIEIETPILGKSTPEGARDYLVPSRLYKGEFYALPQSPQIFKQLLMISGFDRYYQVAKCFRDEDLRSDRQPEFTQIDLEASFIKKETLFNVIEKIFKNLFKDILGIKLKTPFVHMNYEDAINLYGTDKPDTRFSLLIEDFNYLKDINLFSNSESIRGIRIPNSNTLSRKKIENFNSIIKQYNLEFVSFIRNNDNELSGSIKKLLKDNHISNLNLKNNELIILTHGPYLNVSEAIGKIRLEVAKELEYKLEGDNFIWLVNWPLFEKLDDGTLHAAHHPFTNPVDREEFLKDPYNALANSYDLVYNGQEYGSGSIRIHDPLIQQKMFEALNLTQKEIDERFGFFIEALNYGTPPHGGFALGLDRMVMNFTNTTNIRDVIAFPKTQSAKDLMNDSPSKVDNKQLDELGIKTKDTK